MLYWLRMYFQATGQTKLFVINWAIYMLLIIVTTIYVYARLDFVRSGPHNTSDTKIETFSR